MSFYLHKRSAGKSYFKSASDRLDKLALKGIWRSLPDGMGVRMMSRAGQGDVPLAATLHPVEESCV